MPKHEYEVVANLAEGLRPIIWLTDHAQTAHRWYRELCETGRPVDGGYGTVTIAGLYRDGKRVKAASVGKRAARCPNESNATPAEAKVQ